MDLVDRLDGVEVVDSGIEANLVHDGDAGLCSLVVQLAHGVRDVRRRDDVLLVLDGRLDDVGVLGVRDERDDEVARLDRLVERLVRRRVDLERGRRARERHAERLGRLEVAAPDRELVLGVAQDVVCRGLGDKARAEQQDAALRDTFVHRRDLFLGVRRRRAAWQSLLELCGVDDILRKLGQRERGTVDGLRVVARG